jgi:hypothetical protein
MKKRRKRLKIGQRVIFRRKEPHSTGYWLIKGATPISYFVFRILKVPQFPLLHLQTARRFQYMGIMEYGIHSTTYIHALAVSYTVFYIYGENVYT